MKANESAAQLRALADEWADFILAFRGTRINSIVAWRGYDSTLARVEATWGCRSSLEQLGQFTFQLLDQALIQVRYEFAKDAVVRSCLAYVEGPITAALRDLKFQEAISVIANFESNDYHDPEGPPVALRIDYDPASERILEHAACHLHISSLPGARIPVSHVPTPRQFFEFCLRTSLPAMYHEVRSPQIPKAFMKDVNAIATGIASHADGLMAIQVPGLGARNRTAM